MFKKSHKLLAVSLLPLAFVPISVINSNKGDTVLISNIFTTVNEYINGYNLLIDSLFSSYISIVYMAIFLLFYYIGSTLPDLDLKLKYLYPVRDRHKRYLYHRQITHSILVSLSLLVYGIYLFNGGGTLGLLSYIIVGLALGIITHQIGDMITGSIPILLYAPYYIRFARIGITVFLPRSIHPIFTEQFPIFLNNKAYKIFPIIFIISLSILTLIRFL